MQALYGPPPMPQHSLASSESAPLMHTYFTQVASKSQAARNVLTFAKGPSGRPQAQAYGPTGPQQQLQPQMKRSGSIGPLGRQ